MSPFGMLTVGTGSFPAAAGTLAAHSVPKRGCVREVRVATRQNVVTIASGTVGALPHRGGVTSVICVVAYEAATKAIRVKGLRCERCRMWLPKKESLTGPRSVGTSVLP